MRLSLALLGALGAVIAACGLSVVGATDEGEASSSSSGAPSRADGSTPGASDASAEDEARAETPEECRPDACTLPSGAGFALALFGDTAQGCPTDFVASDVIENPVAGAGACTCGACSAQVSCSTGTIPTTYDQGSGTCGMEGTPFQANDGACRNQNGVWGENASVMPPMPAVGPCSATGVATPAAVTTTPKRICTPAASACTALACTPPAGMAACLLQDGDVACPANAPSKHLVGADFTLACASCACSLSVQCGGKAESFPQQNCNGTPTTVMANVCTHTNRTNFASTKWTGTVVSQTCTTGAPPAASIALTNVRTVCCP